MQSSLVVEAKQVGQRRPLLPAWHVPLPPERVTNPSLTLRDLITLIVHEEVRAFRERQEERRLIRVLTAAQIEQGAAAGKVDPGQRDLQQEVNAGQAVTVALQAFENGLYYVFVDDEHHTALDSTIYLQPDSHVLFVRLVALAGG